MYIFSCSNKASCCWQALGYCQDATTSCPNRPASQCPSAPPSYLNLIPTALFSCSGNSSTYSKYGAICVNGQWKFNANETAIEEDVTLKAGQYNFPGNVTVGNLSDLVIDVATVILNGTLRIRSGSRLFVILSEYWTGRALPFRRQVIPNPMINYSLVVSAFRFLP